MSVAAVIQARMGSTRLPGKVLLPLEGRPILHHILWRASHCRSLDKVIVATSDAPEDDAVEDAARNFGVDVFRGDRNDVLDRFWRATETFAIDMVVRLTADCPLLDPLHVDRIVDQFRAAHPALDWAATGLSYPEGYGAEVFSRAALERAWREAVLPSDREHVTSYIWTHPELFRTARIEMPEDLSAYRLTVDEECDLRVVRELTAKLGADKMFGMEAAVDFLRAHPELKALNAHIGRFAGFHKSRAEDQAVS
jgi:spore coat polysaccharide biosynthesis protein SpsF